MQVMAIENTSEHYGKIIGIIEFVGKSHLWLGTKISCRGDLKFRNMVYITANTDIFV